MLDWEEHLFVTLKNLHWRLFRRKELLRKTRLQATFKESRLELLCLGTMLRSAPIQLFETDDTILFHNHHLCFPKSIALTDNSDDNRFLYSFRTAVASLFLKHQRPWPNSPNEAWEALNLPFEDLPGWPDWVARAAQLLNGPGPLITFLGHGQFPSTPPSLHPSLLAPVHPNPDPQPSQPIEEIEGRGQVDVQVLQESALEGPQSNMPEHVFEKTETLQEYNGVLRHSEENHSLRDDEEALREVNMKRLIRTRGRPKSIYRADTLLDGFFGEIETNLQSAGIPYPEWNYRKGTYRHNWCWLLESRTRETHPAWTHEIQKRHARLIRKLRTQFQSVVTDWLRLKQQNMGPELDLDAVISSEVNRRITGNADEKLYEDRHQDLQDVAAYLLMDLSDSTEAWLEGSRVLDVIRESIFCVGEVLSEFIHRFALAGFSSDTRRECRYQIIKDFTDPWETARHRLGATQAQGYTRIGPALRHAHEQLLKQPARRKIAILLTDGRPCDYDRYEGKYGLRDVKKAIETGLVRGIHTHAFAIDKQAAEFFPHMFLPGQFDILPKPEQLSGGLVKLFARLITR